MTAKKPSIDLESLSLPELERLAASVAARIEEVRQAEHEEAFAKLEEMAGKLGIDKAALKARYSSRSRAKATAKFCDPKNASKTWSGRGRQPLWVRDHLAGGGTLDQLRVKA